MSAKHTPGPWIVQESGFRASEFVITTQQRQDESLVPICEMDVDFDGRIGIEQKANARLIAAAPDLLEALKACDEAMSYMSEYDIPITLPAQVKAAIAKAIG